jgi:hypothetical protein
MALMVPEASSTRPKSKPQSPTAPASNVTRVLLDVAVAARDRVHFR